jgi:hypothetical protein
MSIHKGEQKIHEKEDHGKYTSYFIELKSKSWLKSQMGPLFNITYIPNKGYH